MTPGARKRHWRDGHVGPRRDRSSSARDLSTGPRHFIFFLTNGKQTSPGRESLILESPRESPPCFPGEADSTSRWVELVSTLWAKRKETPPLQKASRTQAACG